MKEDINNTDIIREKELGVLPLGVNPLTAPISTLDALPTEL